MATDDSFFLSFVGVCAVAFGVSGAGEPLRPADPAVPTLPEAVEAALPRRPGATHGQSQPSVAGDSALSTSSNSEFYNLSTCQYFIFIHIVHTYMCGLHNFNI